MTPEAIERINFLSQKKKSEGLTREESREQAELRQAYLASVRRNLRHHIEGIKVVDEAGRDITPDKLKRIQAEKGLHQRSLSDLDS